MKDRITEVINKFKGRVDYLELRVEEFTRTGILFRGKKLNVLQESFELGGCARASHKGGVGFVSFNDLDQMTASAKMAVEQAKVVGRGKTVLAEVPVILDDVPVKLINDPREVPLPKKLDLLRGYNELILGYDKHIISSGVRYRDGFKIAWFGNSEGTLIRQEKLDLGCNLSARSKKNGITQLSHTSEGSSTDFNVLLGLED